MNPGFEINIDAITLEGFAPQDRRKIKEAVEQSLIQLFTMPSTDWIAAAGFFDKMDGGCFQAGDGNNPHQLGAQIARSVYSAITGAGNK
ncbi:hypothetical protein A8C56_04780 [Niabella ginsenosidivorans]|uniref:Uncharacterized protein n=1 Tax=Niabella ginsenosidivorans TaxID=1176587 RepID=A0A1A9HYC1_9BACT|nr:hypothetical protein [Niabella ginsenosidivorans]ANH80387.1 hypothetical protein A8C56_04780 [Niabella ginsenosidivorans]